MLNELFVGRAHTSAVFASACSTVGLFVIQCDITYIHEVTKSTFSEVISKGNAWERRSHCRKAAGTPGNGVTMLKCLRTHNGRHCEQFSGQKCTRLQDFAYIQSHNFFREWYPLTSAAVRGDPHPHSPLARPTSARGRKRPMWTKNLNKKRNYKYLVWRTAELVFVLIVAMPKVQLSPGCNYSCEAESAKYLLSSLVLSNSLIREHYFTQ